MPSCIASSFSHTEAFISSKPERTTTVTSSPPRRREERQQSIAVLPPPSTMTRRPILSIWPNETDDLLVGHRFGQAEARDLCSHHAAALGVAVEHDAVIAERGEVARDGQR